MNSHPYSYTVYTLIMGIATFMAFFFILAGHIFVAWRSFHDALPIEISPLTATIVIGALITLVILPGIGWLFWKLFRLEKPFTRTGVLIILGLYMVIGGIFWNYTKTSTTMKKFKALETTVEETTENRAWKEPNDAP